MASLNPQGGPPRVVIFTATYNEVDNIEPLLDRIWAVNPAAVALVVDDHSPDGTGALLDRIASSETRLHVVHRPGKLGLGTAHQLAMLFAIMNDFDILVTMDADLSHDPSDIPKMIDKLDAADFVIGSRYMPGGSCDYTGYRRFVSVAANGAARFLLGIPLHEFTTSYRAFRVRQLAMVNFAKMHNNGYSFFMESVYRLRQAGLSVAEVPIHFRDRTAGQSKIPRFEILNGILKLLHLSVSKMLRRRMPTPLPRIQATCANCHSAFLFEFPPRLRGRKSGCLNAGSDVATGHGALMTAKCLQCGCVQEVP